MTQTPIATRAQRLKTATSSAHDQLDRRIMAAQPFASRANYLRFLHMQHGFHTAVAPLYASGRLAALLPDLTQRARLNDVTADLRDLGETSTPTADLPATLATDLPADLPLPDALGWLYVAEGSNLGAAFLRKYAAGLGLSDSFGARHLAPADEGRGRHWHSFTAMLNQIALPHDDETRMIQSARDAFDRVSALAAWHFR